MISLNDIESLTAFKRNTTDLREEDKEEREPACPDDQRPGRDHRARRKKLSAHV